MDGDIDGDEWGKEAERVDIEYGKEEETGTKRKAYTYEKGEKRKVTGTREGGRWVPRGRIPPVVCRPIDKQRRYCKCIGTTRCGTSLAAFLRDAKRRAFA